MYWMLLPIRRFVDFRGRSRRKEYWMFTLGFAILAAVAAGLQSMLGMDNGGDPATGPLVLMVILALAIPALAVQVRRFHDLNQSGWHVLWNLVPLVGMLVILISMCREGMPEDNRYGPDPKGSRIDMADILG